MSYLFPVFSVRSQSRIDGTINRCIDPEFRAKTGNGPGKPGDFKGVAPIEVVVHGRSHIKRQAIDKCKSVVGIIFRKVDSLGPRHLNRLMHNIIKKPAHKGIFADRSDGGVHQSRGAAQSHQKDKLIPNRAQDILAGLGHDTARLKGRP